MESLPAPLRAALADGGRGLAIAVVRLGAFGDILRTLPPVRLLRFAAPDAKIIWVCDDRWSGILDGHPDIDAVVPFPRRVVRSAARSPLRWVEAARCLARFRGAMVRADLGLALDFHGNLRSGLVARLSASPVRIGFEGHQQKEGNRWLTTHRVPAGPRRRSRMDRNLDLIRGLGLPVTPLPDAGLVIREDARSAARWIAGAPGGSRTVYAVINPGASVRQSYKKPPTTLLAAAASRLTSAGLDVLVTHGPGEEADARAVVALSGQGTRLAPPTDLSVLLALLLDAALFVGGDSGPLHAACAVGCPVVGIYGPTDPVVNGPWGVPCRVVAPHQRVYTGIKRIDRASGGFTGIDVGAVVRAVEELLGERDRRA